MNVNVLRYHPLCFQCGKFFKFSKGEVPSHCLKCRFRYIEPCQFSTPDFIVIGGQRATVVYVDGKPHEKIRRKEKDLRQRERIRELGYQLVVIKNNLIDNAELSWLRVIANGIKYMSANPEFYARVVADEKELVGMGAFKHGY